MDMFALMGPRQLITQQLRTGIAYQVRLHQCAWLLHRRGAPNATASGRLECGATICVRAQISGTAIGM